MSIGTRAAAFAAALVWAAQVAAQPAPALDPAALDVVKHMAAHLRGLPSLRVEAQIEYDAVQPDGQAIEFGSTREIAVRRPDRIRAEATDRSGAQFSLRYDGKQLGVIDHANRVYATAPASGDLDDVVRFAGEKLGVPIPLGELLGTELGEQLEESPVSASLVGVETLDGVRCDHLALRNPDRGIQLWVQQGETPLPRRVAITWEQAPGRPQFRATLAKWEVAPTLSDALFAFEPPAGAERIRFHVRPAAPAAAGGR